MVLFRARRPIAPGLSRAAASAASAAPRGPQNAGTAASADTAHSADSLEGFEWRWLWRHVRPFVSYQIGNLCFVLLSIAVSLTSPLLMKWTIDDVLPGGDWMRLIPVTALFFAVYLGSTVLSSIARLINQLGVMRLVFRMRTRLLHQLEALPAGFYTTHPVGDLVQRVEHDVTHVSDLGSDVLPSIIRMVVQTVMTVAMMVWLDWRLALIICPLLPLFAWLRHYYLAALRRHAEVVREAGGLQTSLLNELLNGMLQLQLLGAERRLGRRYARLNLRSNRLRWQQRTSEIVFTLLMMCLTGFGMALIVGYGGWRVMTGGLSAGSFVALYSYITAIFSPLTMATELYGRASRVRASITRLMAIERAPAELNIVDAPDAVALAGAPRRVSCVDLRFGYRPDAPVLNDVSLEIRAGEHIAIVGRSGCGKSSLLKLLPRMYDPAGGRVEIDGRDLRTLRIASVRAAIAFVPQEPILFQGTLRENLRHGRPDASTEALDRAAWIACLTDVVARLPQGWDTPLGPMGAGLSGGERQRVAIARALLQDRPILILDEATSAVDAETEHRLLERLRLWGRGRTLIIVSHRQSAARWAQRVIVVDRGRIVEDGSHDALERPRTAYYALWHHQPASPDASGMLPGV